MHLCRLHTPSTPMHSNRSTFWNLGTQLAHQETQHLQLVLLLPATSPLPSLAYSGSGDRQTHGHSHQKPRIFSKPNRPSNAPWRRSTTCSSCPAPPLNSCELPRLTLEPMNNAWRQDGADAPRASRLAGEEALYACSFAFPLVPSPRVRR